MEDKKEVYVSIRKKPWKDLDDNEHIYKEGDIYPREGLEVDKKRIKELSSTKNKIGEILIQKTEILENKSTEEDKDDLEQEKTFYEDLEENTKLEESEDNIEGKKSE